MRPTNFALFLGLAVGVFLGYLLIEAIGESLGLPDLGNTNTFRSGTEVVVKFIIPRVIIIVPCLPVKD